MKKLTFSLVAAILIAVIFLGWGIDTFFNQYQQQDADEYDAYRNVISSLAKTLDAEDNSAQFVATWQSQNKHQLTVVPLSEFPLPQSVQNSFLEGEALVLESAQQITVNQIMPKHQQVLMMSMPKMTSNQENFSLQVMLTTLFYAGILFCVFIWLYPLIRRLRLLRSTAKTFGEGNFSKRIVLSPTSYIADIENEFNRMAQKIETLVQDNKLLSNAVSHDLRTPLARLRFGIEALNETTNAKNKEKYIRHLNNDIAEMEKLVAVLLNYARLEQNMVKVERVSVNLNMLTEECIQSSFPNHQNHLLKITTNSSKKELFTKGDEHFLSMLINNLLNNAKQYAKQKIHLEIQNNAQGITLSVSDDGPGIPTQKRIGLFTPFTRGHDNPEQTGFGMGLAIVKRIADWHNATVDIDHSTELGGAKFTVIFSV